MRPYFYLSYAQADDGRAIQIFFRDLSDEIRVREKLPDTEIVGCCGGEHFGNRDEGLQASRLMLALVSPNYLTDHAVEGDWHTFERRKARITRINWLQQHEPLPNVVASTPVFPQQLNGNRFPPLAVMIAAIEKYKAQYAEFVNNLADYIIASPASPQVSELDSIPEDEKITKRHKIVNKNKLVIDGTFVKELAEQIKTAATPAPVSNVSFSGQTTHSTKAGAEKYTAVTIDDNPADIHQIEIMARMSPDFGVVTSYTDADRLLDNLATLSEHHREPDLIVVNPALTVPKTHGYKLIDVLLERKVPSAILATSKDPLAIRSLRLRGINDLVAILPESFTPKEKLELMKHWAKIGRDNRYRRGRSEERPVFLSFRSTDEPMAGQICKSLESRSIGVWYSYETLKPGDPWIEKIKQGLANAKVFIALISDEYPKSDYCKGELANILLRVANETPPPLVIPVHYHSPTTALEDPEIKNYLNQQAVNIPWDMDWQLGCGTILKAVRDFLKPNETQFKSFHAS